jgi:MraZ protein
MWGSMGGNGEKWISGALWHVFLGEFEHTVDERGRIAIPARFRQDLTAGLVVTRGIEACLSAWPMDGWNDIAEKLSDLSVMQADARKIHRYLFSSATHCTLDRIGRILVPSFLRDYADLKDNVVIVGLLNRLEIWSRTRWEEERAGNERESADIAEHLSRLGV